MKPQPPAGSPHRRGTPPSLVRPSSPSAFPAAADGDREADVSEHPCVTLVEWWLATVEEGDDQKIAVAGTFERNQALLQYSPAPIAKCHDPVVLETEDGAILRLHGSHKVSRTFANGYSTTVCAEFLKGFPDCWQSCKPCNPKLTNSHTECQPCSSNASDSGVDSTIFLLERFELASHVMSKFHEISESFSQNDVVFQKSSHLLNGTSRFEEYTCDDDITTNENAAASSEAATGDQRTPVVSLEVRGCRKETQHVHMSLTEKEAVEKEMPSKVGNSPSRERGHDDIAHRTTETNYKRTLVASLKSQGSSKENQHIPSNKKPVGQSKKEISPHVKCRSATRSPGTRNPEAYVLSSPLIRDKATSLSRSISTPEDLKLNRSRSGRVIVPKLIDGLQSIVYGKDGMIAAVLGLDSPAVPKCKTDRREKRKFSNQPFPEEVQSPVAGPARLVDDLLSDRPIKKRPMKPSTRYAGSEWA